MVETIEVTEEEMARLIECANFRNTLYVPLGLGRIYTGSENQWALDLLKEWRSEEV